jgi:hypothetical protein
MTTPLLRPGLTVAPAKSTGYLNVPYGASADALHQSQPVLDYKENIPDVL